MITLGLHAEMQSFIKVTEQYTFHSQNISEISKAHSSKTHGTCFYRKQFTLWWHMYLLIHLASSVCCIMCCLLKHFEVNSEIWTVLKSLKQQIHCTYLCRLDSLWTVWKAHCAIGCSGCTEWLFWEWPSLSFSGCSAKMCLPFFLLI